ncbi:hypothetical protein [Alkalihalobacillus sp. MEB130]|nr:hypothetical protein [Alkalihalobacillus sp. MEB130]
MKKQWIFAHPLFKELIKVLKEKERAPFSPDSCEHGGAGFSRRAPFKKTT